jgi:hypothetical protein
VAGAGRMRETGEAAGLCARVSWEEVGGFFSWKEVGPSGDDGSSVGCGVSTGIFTCRWQRSVIS